MGYSDNEYRNTIISGNRYYWMLRKRAMAIVGYDADMYTALHIMKELWIPWKYMKKLYLVEEDADLLAALTGIFDIIDADAGGSLRSLIQTYIDEEV